MSTGMMQNIDKSGGGTIVKRARETSNYFPLKSEVTQIFQVNFYGNGMSY